MRYGNPKKLSGRVGRRRLAPSRGGVAIGQVDVMQAAWRGSLEAPCDLIAVLGMDGFKESAATSLEIRAFAVGRRADPWRGNHGGCDRPDTDSQLLTEMNLSRRCLRRKTPRRITGSLLSNDNQTGKAFP